MILFQVFSRKSENLITEELITETRGALRSNKSTVDGHFFEKKAGILLFGTEEYVYITVIT